MTTEDYVSFETAKLLKEKGFDGFCNRYYQTDKEDVNGEYAMFMFASDLESFCTVTNSLLNKYADKNQEIISAPTLQMVMKWLRDIHGLFIHIDVIREASCWTADIQDIKNDVAVYPVKEEFPGYEEACGAAIKYCLKNLI